MKKLYNAIKLFTKYAQEVGPKCQVCGTPDKYADPDDPYCYKCFDSNKHKPTQSKPKSTSQPKIKNPSGSFTYFNTPWSYNLTDATYITIQDPENSNVKIVEDYSVRIELKEINFGNEFVYHEKKGNPLMLDINADSLDVDAIYATGATISSIQTGLTPSFLPTTNRHFIERVCEQIMSLKFNAVFVRAITDLYSNNDFPYPPYIHTKPLAFLNDCHNKYGVTGKYI